MCTFDHKASLVSEQVTVIIATSVAPWSISVSTAADQRVKLNVAYVDLTDTCC